MIVDEIKNMYEKYPYPPVEEKNIKFKRANLKIMNYICYNGEKDFDNFSILVAGCGTGDTVMAFALQLQYYTNCEIIGVDISKTSLDIAQQRIDKLKYSNLTIKLYQKSILDIDFINQFDFIDCCGVLHHIPNHLEALSKLEKALKPDGCLEIMVYSKIARDYLYLFQELLNKFNADSIENKIKVYKKLYTQLPNNHLFKIKEHLVRDHILYQDVGIADELLHPYNIGFHIDEIPHWLSSSNLKILDFSDYSGRWKYFHQIPKIDYHHLSTIEIAKTNELFFGDIINHHVYVGKQSHQMKPTIDDLENIILLNFIDKYSIQELIIFMSSFNMNQILEYNITSILANIMDHNMAFNAQKDNCIIYIKFKKTKYISDLLELIIQEQFKLKTIFKIIIDKYPDDNLTNKLLLDELRPVFNEFEKYFFFVLAKTDSNIF